MKYGARHRWATSGHREERCQRKGCGLLRWFPGPGLPHTRYKWPGDEYEFRAGLIPPCRGQKTEGKG